MSGHLLGCFPKTRLRSSRTRCPLQPTVPVEVRANHILRHLDQITVGLPTRSQRSHISPLRQDQKGKRSAPRQEQSAEKAAFYPCYPRPHKFTSIQNLNCSPSQAVCHSFFSVCQGPGSHQPLRSRWPSALHSPRRPTILSRIIHI